jgi:drug/metabolite transporter (DMT)-like permease
MSPSREKAFSDRIGLLLGGIGIVLFAGTLPGTRLAVVDIEPLFLTAARATIAGCAGLLVLMAMRRPPPSRANLARCLIAGLFTVLLFPLFAALAMMTVPASHGGVVLGILPLATTAAATVLADERPSAGFWLASAAGAALVLFFMIRHSGIDDIGWGDLFLLCTVVAGAVGYTYSARATAHLPGWEVIRWSVVIFLPLGIVFTFLLWPADIASIRLPSWSGLLYVGLVSQYFAFFVYNAAMAITGVARVAQLLLLQPFVIVGLAYLVNGEPIEFETLAFAGGVVAIVVLGQRMRVTRGGGALQRR